MNHLKSINEYYIDHNIEIVRDLQDICLELTDVGFTCYCTPRGVDQYHSCIYGISIYKFDSERSLIVFSYKEVAETVERIKSYMKQRGHSTSVKKIDTSTPSNSISQILKRSYVIPSNRVTCVRLTCKNK